MQETAQWLPDSSKRLMNCLNKKILCPHECDSYRNFTGGGSICICSFFFLECLLIIGLFNTFVA